MPKPIRRRLPVSPAIEADPIAVVTSIMLDPRSTAASRLRAAKLLLDERRRAGGGVASEVPDGITARALEIMAARGLN